MIFLDIGLPGMDGYAVAKALRAHSRTSKTSIVALTGYGQQGDIRKTREAGFNHHLVKPVDMKKISDILAKEMQNKSSSVGSAV
jgi:CheY-like chemotaxis protein